MTRERELLRETLPYIGQSQWQRASDLEDEIRAYLAEPQGEPKYVWRVLLPRDEDGSEPLGELSLNEGNAKANARIWCGRVERAQLGPWEVVG